MDRESKFSTSDKSKSKSFDSKYLSNSCIPLNPTTELPYVNPIIKIGKPKICKVSGRIYCNSNLVPIPGNISVVVEEKMFTEDKYF